MSKVLKIKYFSPRRILIYSVLTWIFIRVISIHTYKVDLNIYGISYILSMLLMYILGTYLYDFAPKIKSKNKSYKSIYEKLLNLRMMIYISLFGLILRFYDLIINKQYFSYQNASDFRSSYEGGGYGISGIISSFMFPISIVLLIYLILEYKKIIKKDKILIGVINILFILYSVLMGSRTQITLVFISILIAFMFKYKEVKINIKNKLFVVILLFIAIFMIYSNHILLERLSYQGKTVESAILYMENKHYLNVQDWVWNIVGKNDFIDGCIYTYISLTHYFVHGIYEFQEIVNNFNLNNIALGSYQFNPIMKFFGIFGLNYLSIDKINLTLHKTGVYTSFVGPVYIDFGYFGFIYIFFLGIISQKIWVSSKYSLRSKILYCLIASIIFHSSFLNMILYGMGIYFIVDFIIALYIFSRIRF